MKVLILSWRDIDNPRAGGAERLTFEHARHWAKAGNDVTLFTAHYAGAIKEDNLQGVRIIRRGSPVSVHVCAQHWYRRQKCRPDIVVDEIHGIPFCALAYAGVPVVALIHEVARSIWFSMYNPSIALFGYAFELASLRWYARRAVPFLVNSPSTRAELAIAGVAPASTTLIPPGIGRAPLPALPEKEKDPTLVYLGRIVPMKGVADAIRTLAHVRKQYPGSRLWVIGTGPSGYRASLDRLAATFGLGTAVQFTGPVNEEEKFALLARAHVLIHPSLREGWGINVIEANAMGTPAVGYDVPGLRDSIVPHETGILCDPGNAADLAREVIGLLGDSQRYRAFQRAALNWSQYFTWDVATAASLGLLRRVVVGNPTPTSGRPAQHIDGIRLL